MYNSTMYHQNISNSVGVIAITRFLLLNTIKGFTHKKTAVSRVVVLECDFPSQPSVQPYKELSIYARNSKGVRVTKTTSFYYQILSGKMSKNAALRFVFHVSNMPSQPRI